MSVNNNLSSLKYKAYIDGLRAIAVLAVVIYHAFPTVLKGGFIGVDIFFVISGFLISSIIFENLNSGSFSFKEFYIRRFRRIFPALIFVLTFCIIFGWMILLPEEYQQLGKHVSAGAGFVSNLVLWSEAGYFDNVSDFKPLLHLWSLAVEEQFYLIWPLILWLAHKYKINLLNITFLIATISFSININNVHENPTSAFYSPLSRFWELLFGALLAWYALKNNTNNKFSANKIFLFITNKNFISIIGISLIIFSLLKFDKLLPFPGYWALIPVLGSVFIIAAGTDAWFNHKILSAKLLVWFGLISFPLYLWHWPLLAFARIINNGEPDLSTRVIAVFMAILLAWFTFKVIEKPFRFGEQFKTFKVALLCCLMLSLFIIGLLIKNEFLLQGQAFDKLVFKRVGYEHGFGSSLNWYRGKNDWLFLGNNYDKIVAKNRLAITPSIEEINNSTSLLTNLASVGLKSNTHIVMLVGPNKSSVYQEYLPNNFLPSKIRYVDYFLEPVNKIPNLTLYNPLNDFLLDKNTEGLLYWRTDTHWNSKGAFLAFSRLSQSLDIPFPEVTFKQGSAHKGDLIEISKLKDFPLHQDDNWTTVWKNKPQWTETQITGEKETPFGSVTIVKNKNPLSNKIIWVVGDSYTIALKQFFNATYKEVHYIGHWADKLQSLPNNLEKSKDKPDMIVIVKVERSF